MASGLVVQVVQYAPATTPDANLEAMAPHIEQAAAKGATIVVFPEYSDTFFPGDGKAMARVAEGLDGRFLQGLQALSKDNQGIIVCAGMVMNDDGVRNTMVAAGPDGLVARAEKLHLYDAFGNQESAWCSPGRITPPQMVECEGFTIGFIACYDLRFPETTRRLVDSGADVIVVPAQWVPGPRKTDHWDTLLRARAIETQCYVVAADHPEPNGVGLSQVISPRGDVLARCAAGEESLMVELHMSEVEAVRSENPMAAARRFSPTAL